MPTARYTGGGHYRVAGYGFDPGDEREVDHELANYLTDNDDFEVSVEKETPGTDGTDEDEAPDEAEPEADDSEFDVGEFLDRTPVDDVVEDIHAGEADEYLEAVAEAADRVTVQDAIGERRAELEG